mmetsp:Transcript_23153/g.40958  ORF Transcript_23153/g.40958 Transcript_23153/m.40958 type:complete len:275 (+) Transcript_23153:1487-2311(+)
MLSRLGRAPLLATPLRLRSSSAISVNSRSSCASILGDHLCQWLHTAGSRDEDEDEEGEGEDLLSPLFCCSLLNLTFRPVLRASIASKWPGWTPLRCDLASGSVSWKPLRDERFLLFVDALMTSSTCSLDMSCVYQRTSLTTASTLGYTCSEPGGRLAPGLWLAPQGWKPGIARPRRIGWVERVICLGRTDLVSSVPSKKTSMAWPRHTTARCSQRRRGTCFLLVTMCGCPPASQCTVTALSLAPSMMENVVCATSCLLLLKPNFCVEASPVPTW